MIYTKKFNVPKLHLQLYEFCCGAVWGHGGGALCGKLLVTLNRPFAKLYL